MSEALRALIVDDEPLAVERLQIICAALPDLSVIGTANDGAAALRLIDALAPDIVLLDITMPELDGLGLARALSARALSASALSASALSASALSGSEAAPAVVFVTAHDGFAVEAFDLEAVDYVLKPVEPGRLERAIARAVARRGGGGSQGTVDEDVAGDWITEFWIPHRSELVRIAAGDIDRIDAERDYVRLHVGEASYLLLRTVSSLEERLDPGHFIRVHRSTILRRDRIRGLSHDGMGGWSADLGEGDTVRIGRTYLDKVKAMAGR